MSPYVRFDLKLVAIKAISWSYDDLAPKEQVTFEYGGMIVRYSQQNANGSFNSAIVGGWNVVKNVSDQDLMASISFSCSTDRITVTVLPDTLSPRFHALRPRAPKAVTLVSWLL